VRPDDERAALRIELSSTLVPVLGNVLARVRNLFDLAARPDAIDAHLGAHKALAELVTRTPGLRVPGAFCGFELAWRAVLGQQVSVRAATTVAGRVAREFGEPLATPIAGLDRTSPVAQRLVQCGPKAWASVGVLASRGATIRDLAAAVAGGSLCLGPTPTPESVLTQLRAFRGIGEWTAEYIAMRALRWPDAFPETDLVLQRALMVPRDGKTTSSEKWSPWRAYAAMHLWNAAAVKRGGL
jgi:AraC family transcriptional regulator of adaptative response / DNA-3-methyladenine glycosylase II